MTHSTEAEERNRLFPVIERTWAPLPIGVLVSGSGSNLQAIIDEIAAGSLYAEIKVVISNVPDAYGLARAQKAGIPAVVVNHKDYGKDRAAFEDKLIEILLGCGTRLVVLAGFMRILSPRFVGEFPQRIINIHPALLPSFPGVDAQTQAFEYGVKISGCTTHFVDEACDHGPIILQKAVAVMEEDDRDALQKRILEQEHRLLPASVQLYADGRIVVEGRKTKILPPDQARGWQTK